MNNRLAVRQCNEYNAVDILRLIPEIYRSSGGPDVSGKRVLVKPNILSDNDPAKCISTHPSVVEAMVRFLQSEGATVLVGDSPAIHTKNFRPKKSGIQKVCEITGASWVDFTKNSVEIKLNTGTIKVASIIHEVDLIISIPKFKNHELVYFTGAIKNTLGLVPGFHKTKQHALHHDRNDFSKFLVDLNEAVTPDYFLMDAIDGMEGPGPGRGMPVKIGLLMGSTNPLALDLIASRIACYDPVTVPTNMIGMLRKIWLRSEDEIIYDGPVLKDIIKENFRRIPVSRVNNISIKFILNRVNILRKFERRPVFIHKKCTGCHKCIRICSVQAIIAPSTRKDYIILTDSKCIRCFCCSEVCTDNAVEIKRKVFGR